MKRILVSMLLLSVVVVGHTREAALNAPFQNGPFQCEESNKLSENEARLARWGSEIEREAQEFNRIDKQGASKSHQNKQKLVDLIRMTLCFSQVQGDATIFEHWLPMRAERSFQSALSALSSEEQRRVREAFLLISRSPQYE